MMNNYGMPRIEGMYPRTSQNEIREGDIEDACDKTLARARRVASSTEVVSAWRPSRIICRLIFFLWTTPVFFYGPFARSGVCREKIRKYAWYLIEIRSRLRPTSGTRALITSSTAANKTYKWRSAIGK